MFPWPLYSWLKYSRLRSSDWFSNATCACRNVCWRSDCSFARRRLSFAGSWTPFSSSFVWSPSTADLPYGQRIGNTRRTDTYQSSNLVHLQQPSIANHSQCQFIALQRTIRQTILPAEKKEENKKRTYTREYSSAARNSSAGPRDRAYLAIRICRNSICKRHSTAGSDESRTRSSFQARPTACNKICSKWGALSSNVLRDTTNYDKNDTYCVAITLILSFASSDKFLPSENYREISLIHGRATRHSTLIAWIGAGSRQTSYHEIVRIAFESTF